MSMDAGTRERNRVRTKNYVGTRHRTRHTIDEKRGALSKASAESFVSLKLG